MCGWIFSTTFLISRIIRRDIVMNVKTSSCEVNIILVGFEWHLNFLDGFSKKVQISNFIKIRTVRAELVHAGGQTYMTKLVVAFGNSANVSNEWRSSSFGSDSDSFPRPENIKQTKA